MRSTALRRRLFLLAAVGIVPLAAMSGIGLLAMVQQQHEQIQRSSLDITRALATAVDAELNRSVSLLEGLALAPSLDAADVLGFHITAQRLLSARPQWRGVILALPDGRVLVNTAYLGSEAPPAVVESASFTKLVRTRQPVVGQLRRGPRGEYAVPVRVPVVRSGELRYVLTGVVDPSAIREVVERQRVPSDWVVSVFDDQGLRVARSRGHKQFLATPAAPSLQQLMAGAADEGTGVTHTLEGDQVITAYTRLPRDRWAVAIGVPVGAAYAGIFRSSAAYGAGILLSLLLGGLAALAVARSINRPMGELRRAAQSLGLGDPPRLPLTDIREIREVADALLDAAQQRAQVEAERDRLLDAERAAHAAAEQARRRLELLASAGTVLSRSLQPQATLEAIASIVVPAIADWCRVDLVDVDGRLQRALTHHSDPEKARIGAELVQRLQAAPDTPGSMAWTVATGRSHLARFDPPVEFDAARDKDLLTFAEAIGMRAYFIVPLVARGRTLGALAALQAESQRQFSDDDCALIAEIAQRASLALDNARLYADAQAARRQAETANRAKDEFLAMLGHELRNPLAPIVTALHLMARRGDGDTTMERRIIERQVAHLSRLVDDLLDVSRIARGKIQLEQERIDLRTAVATALELTQPALEQRVRAVDVELPDEPAFVAGDAVRLAQVLGNLLTNAAKFTPPDGRIALRLRRDGDAVELAVEDDGSGIAPELLPHVFDLFTQGEQGMDRRTGGLGLGLAIVKTLVRLHGGTVSAHSDGAGRGSRFVVRLPAAGAPPPPAAPQAGGTAPVHRCGRILLVDDNRDAADMLCVLLRDAGHEVCTASDAVAALAALGHFAPDLALLDIGLPGMDGYELASRLRGDPRTAGLCLVALTGYGRESDRMRALAIFDEHLVKPVVGERLLEVVARLLARRPAPAVTTAVPAP